MSPDYMEFLLFVRYYLSYSGLLMVFLRINVCK